MDISVTAIELDYVSDLENLMMKMAWNENRRFARELNCHKLTLPQLHTLVAIKDNSLKCTMGYLADETNQVSATMTGIIDRLLERGLVERFQHPHDRRKVLVQLTEQGNAKLEVVFAARRNNLTSILQKLDEPTCHSLAFSLRQYLNILETVS